MKALVIVGPTAVGKSRLGMELACSLGGEIVSIDSRQVYRKLDIGTAKPGREDREKVPHHLIDILELEEAPDAEWYAGRAEDAIDDIALRGKVPILVGGSGLYLKSITDGLFDIDLDPVARRDFALSKEGASTVELYEYLRKVDGPSASRIHPNDRYRILRALEVYTLSGKTLSDHFRDHRASRDGRTVGKFVKLGLAIPGEELHRRIAERTRAMLESGWEKEVRDILESGTDRNCPGLKTLGYPEVIRCLDGEIDRDTMAGDIVTRTRRYAKRQMTWFKKEKDVDWIDPSLTDPLGLVMKILDSRESNC